jgi:hypothetical protein
MDATQNFVYGVSIASNVVMVGVFGDVSIVDHKTGSDRGQRLAGR